MLQKSTLPHPGKVRVGFGGMHLFTSVKPSCRISSKFPLAKQASILQEPTEGWGSQKAYGRSSSSGHSLFLLLPKTKSWSSWGTAFISHMCSLLVHADSWAKVKACTGHAHERAAGRAAERCHTVPIETPQLTRCSPSTELGKHLKPISSSRTHMKTAAEKRFSNPPNTASPVRHGGRERVSK